MVRKVLVLRLLVFRSEKDGNYALQMGRSGLAGIDVEKSSSDHLSQTEIGGDNPCSRHLSGISDFLLLAIQIAEGLDAAHAEGGFFFRGF